MTSTLVVSTAEDLLAPLYGANKQILDIMAALRDNFDLALITYGDADVVDQLAALIRIPADRIHVFSFRRRLAALRAVGCGSLKSAVIRDFEAERSIIARYRRREGNVRLLVDGIAGAPLVKTFGSGTVISCHDCSSAMFYAEAQRSGRAARRMLSALRGRGARNLERRYLHRSEAVHVVKKEDGELLRAINLRANYITISLASAAAPVSSRQNSTCIPQRRGAILIWGDLRVGFAARGIARLCPLLAGLDVTVLGSAPREKFRSLVPEFAGKFKYVDRAADLDSFLSQFEVIVIPDDAGGGQKNRTLDAMRMGRCIVGLEPAFFGLPHAEKPYFVRVNTFDEMSSVIRDGMANGSCGAFGKSAEEVFQADFGWETFRSKWQACIGNLAFLGAYRGRNE